LEPAEDAFEGDLYVLIDEACFSMNSFLLSLLTYHNIGTVVGTPSSGGYMCSDASKNAALRNTGLRLRYSTQAFQTAVDGQTPGIGIEPDIRVARTIEDYLKQHDPVLEAAFSVAGIR
jgi:C-terminal processing protease CtpA/Prc